MGFTSPTYSTNSTDEGTVIVAPENTGGDTGQVPPKK